jgi:hypothetical protein
MKKILLWDPRFPKRQPTLLNVDDAIASIAVRTGVAAPFDPADTAGLMVGGAADGGALVPALLKTGVYRDLARVMVPLLVAQTAEALGLAAAIDGRSFGGKLTPGPIDVLFVIGDSNARGTAEDYTTPGYTNDSLVITWNGAAFVTYIPGTRTGVTVPNAAAGSETYPGPEMQYARAYRAANPSKPFAIVKYARAGSYQTYSTLAPINSDATNSWDVSSGTLWSGAKAALEAAVQKLATDGFTPTVIAMIDILGTNDASSTNTSPNVQAAKLAMHASFRTSSAYGPGTAILVQRMKADSPQPQNLAVRTAQAAAANAAADAHLVDTDGFSSNTGDPTHYNIAGLVQVGNAHFAKRTARLTVQSIALKSKLSLMFDAADAYTVGLATPTTVQSFFDGANSKIISQATAGSRPGVGAVNGKVALDFDGADDGLALTATNALGSGAREFFAIVDSDAPGADATTRTFFARGGGTSALDFRLSRVAVAGVSRFRFQMGAAGGNRAIPDTNVVADGVHVVRARYDPTVTQFGTMYIQVDGATEVPFVMPDAQNVTDGFIFLGNGNSSQFFDGRVRLLWELSTLATAPEAASLVADLKAEAGV